MNAHGSWNWSNLHTPDVEAVTGFYEQLFGWELAEVDAGGAEYARMWRRPGYGDHLASLVEPDIRERQDVSGAAPRLRRRHQLADHRHGVAVAMDGDVHQRRHRRHRRSVVEHGGSMVSEPIDQGPTRLAVVADDQGATFTMNTFYPERLSGRGG